MRLLVIAALLTATDPQTVPPPAAPQTFRSGTQIVEVDVRVIGKDGRFVTDLALADFEITEDGVPQRLQSLALIGANQAPSAPLAPVAPVAPAPLAPSAPLAPLAPTARPPQTWVFVFDTTHLSPGGLNRSREAVVKFVGERFHEGDMAGIVIDGKMVNNRMTSDREELRKAAAAVKMPGERRSRQLELREWPRLQDELEAFRIVRRERDAIQAAVTRACSDDPDACKRAAPDMQVMSKASQMVAAYRAATLQTLAVVDVLSKGLARMPGPKTVVFLSEGFVVEDQTSQLRQAVGQAARAGAHFYSIDARGLNKGPNANLIDQAVVANSSGAAPSFDAQEDGTNSLAVDTGGIAIRNENNFGRALDDIQRDAGTYYVVGYAPTKDTFDGKYREISVKVTRPDVKVRARRGYLAVAPATLLRPTLRPADASSPPTASAVAPKLRSEEPGAKAEDIKTLEPPVTPEPANPTPDVGSSVPLATPAQAAVRVRVNRGVMTLRSASAASDASRGFGETSSALKASAELGWAAYEKGDVETAAHHLGQAAKAADARPWVVYALGLSHFALRHFDDAAQAWERVRRDVPEFEPVYFSLADAYGLQHEEGTALKVLREAEKRWPADAEIANAIGVIQIRRGALDAAIESFERATTTAPDDALGYFNLARTHQMRLLKSRRYDRLLEKWVGGDEDRRRAVANFQKYLQLGGPYERQAREALSALGWR